METSRLLLEPPWPALVVLNDLNRLVEFPPQDDRVHVSLAGAVEDFVQVVDVFQHLFGQCQAFGRAVIAFEDSALLRRLEPESPLSRLPYSEDFSIAAEYWWLVGLPEQALIAAANDFRLAPHRLDVVAEKDGVKYWNDSKSTNFHSALAAFSAAQRPIVWIGGGRMKGGDLEAFAGEVSSQVDVAVLYGEVATGMADALEGKLAVVRTLTVFEEAVKAAGAIAREMAPANVLLSPGFSSLDQFNSYEERGKSFISIVLGL